MFPWSSEAEKLQRATRKLFEAIAEGDEEKVRALLRKGNVDVNKPRDDDYYYGWTPLHYASSNGHVHVVEMLLKANADPNATSKYGWTSLHEASSNGHVHVVEMLLKANADPNVTDEDGWIPLHEASGKGHVQVVEMLLKVGADLHARAKDGQTPLHVASKMHESETVRALLAVGANVHSKDNQGQEPLHACVQRTEYCQFTNKTLKTLQVLVANGATWDVTCDDMVASGTAWEEAPALRLCILMWAQEQADGLELSDIPIEVIQRGIDSTQAFIAALKTSLQTVLRRKICLVGSSCAGKTSFVKSITSELLQPQLEHVDDRTIGIDHFPLRFKQSRASRDGTKIHEVTFWDFAGQDAYQVAHSLFFSPRTMFLVFVDLQAFAIAYMQAAIFANFEFQETKLLDEFVEDAIKHWIRMVLTRRPDADIVFVATKEDSLSENTATESLLKDELKAKLRDVQAVMEEMRCKVEAKQIQTPAGPTGETLDGTAIEPRVVCVSCTSSGSIRTARTVVEDLIIQSKLSVPMPDQYAQVLKAIVKIRKEAESLDVAKRIKRIFAAVSTLPAMLQVDKELCRIILQTLHDLGDVLWYEDLDVELFKNTVILDPMLLIDFIRQVITHRHKGQTMSHADLQGKDLWIGLPTDDTTLMEAMKQLLQYFHLVYSAAPDRVMRWDSSLIVPASWQTGIPASWKFLGGKLKVKTSKDTSYSERVRVRWEYHFQHWLPPQMFNQLVVASVSPMVTLDAGPDWIMYEGADGNTACRIMIDRDLPSLHPTIRIEAVVADAAAETQAEYIWAVFQHLVVKFVGVLSEYKGVVVSSYALNDNDKKEDLQDLLLQPPSPLQAITSKWMPPVEMWESCSRKSD